ncbi:hypothetical protein JP75_18370 [Devosia riboflavina]|uniref:DUF1468 domain-containing protein n=1 Tax=Devosia riboflavina TaxID=46914 RepID=A0A087LZJ3_9HYPH|nr:tripartite tricarboxylate transporter TctB family protein [Devosia riboflavina]KFL30046.1 hypothetical protein JP75_18370 [Devosia riboflavina]
MRNGNWSDIYGGLGVAALGLLALWLCLPLPMGTLRNMGAGLFPFLAGGIVAAIGVAIAARGIFRPHAVAETWDVRSFVSVCGAIALFVFGLDRLGLPLTILGMVAVGGLGTGTLSLLEVLIVGGALALICTIGFVVLLGVPMPLMGAWR